MSLIDLLRIPVWTGFAAVLLFIIMLLDSLFTRYSDFQEMKSGNVAVTTRFVMKLLAQAFILFQSITKSSLMWEAFLITIVSFVVLLIMESLFRFILDKSIGLRLDQGIREGKIAYALLAGSVHIAGALIIGAI
ncbi:DUF350 domain-containing protein [Paenibacillus sp. GCM10012307]|uniref:DUF350 domain-containing protein n=1 Tax=Paenibacillus roseus TaxID=2798579 RepID=A0A934MMD8_9BACL|nr:DUF350 domain-containing protein [Paenibacillus roseus]MBJ6363205.1 DUF350 domain-containing protein [Paenibacillus roseus]